MNYFAYGSNMSSQRLIERVVNFISKEKGTLKGYRFIINKKSQKFQEDWEKNRIDKSNIKNQSKQQLITI